MRRSVLDAVPSPNGNGKAHAPSQAHGPNPCLANRAIWRADLTPAEARVLGVIADKAGHGRSVCTVSYETMADLAHTTRRVARKLVKRLAGKLWITVKPTITEKGDAGANEIRVGPRFRKAIKEQIRRERDAKKRVTSMGSARALRGGVRTDPRVGTKRTSGWGPSGPEGGDQADPQTTPLNDSFERLPLTSSSSSTPPPRRKRPGDDDDVRFASQKSGGTKEKPEPLPDDEGLEMVCLVASKCAHLPGMAAKLRGAIDLETRIEHDWRGLARQVVRLEELVAAGEIKFRTIENPAGYVVGMLKKLRSTKLPAGKMDALDAKVERLLKPVTVPPQAGTVVPPARPRKGPAPQPRPDQETADELEASLSGLEANVASAPDRTAKRIAQLALHQAREELAALKTAGSAAP